MTDVRDAATTTSTNDNGPNPPGDYIWYELITPDPVAAKAFYDAVVGWTIEPQPSGEMDYRMIGRSDGRMAGGVMRLTGEMVSHGARPIWLGYLNVDDVDATVASIEQAGGKVLLAAFDIPNVGRIAMVADPQGAPFYVMKPIPPAGQEKQASDVFSVDKPQHVRWNELATTDPDGAIAFYRDQFGWSQEGDMDMGEMGKYRFIQSHGTNIGAVMPKPPQLPVTKWTYYIGVDDIDRAAEAVKSGGGQVVNGPMEIPGGEFAANAIDPQGASFGLVGPRK
ncbi:VOC family protein [Sphingomonas sp. URHD0057]|uniref:VOC family protein n=1 Tax=Sphingomonas sp. URHD0057 TaxID=1380389 RepID=UPI0006881CF5|nr:VOC family protein [Sphingomonas sp. URHD0057]